MSTFSEIAADLLAQKPPGCAWNVRQTLKDVERLLGSGHTDHTGLRQALDELAERCRTAALQAESPAHECWLREVREFVVAAREHELP